MENRIDMDNLGVAPFQETTIWQLVLIWRSWLGHTLKYFDHAVSTSNSTRQTVWEVLGSVLGIWSERVAGDLGRQFLILPKFQSLSQYSNPVSWAKLLQVSVRIHVVTQCCSVSTCETLSSQSATFEDLGAEEKHKKKKKEKKQKRGEAQSDWKRMNSRREECIGKVQANRC